MAKRPLKVCVIGAGDMGLRHLKGWAGVEGAEIVALVDDAPARLETAAGLLPRAPALFTDYRTAITTTRPEVVSVCIPTAFHGAASLFAIDQGAHVLCEKPISLSLEEAYRMIEAAESKGVLLTVGFMLRYSPGIKQLKDWIVSGEIGRPILAHSENYMEVRPKVLMHAKNVNGGPLMDYWCHQFDLWGYLFESQPESVSGNGMIFAAGKPEVAGINPLALDTAAVTVRYQSGDIGQFSTSWGLPRALAGKAISGDKFIGPQGIISGDIRKELTLLDRRGESRKISNRATDWWETEIAAMAGVIREGGRLPVDGRNGLEALRLSLAALEAIETGRTVELRTANRL